MIRAVSFLTGLLAVAACQPTASAPTNGAAPSIPDAGPDAAPQAAAADPVGWRKTGAMRAARLAHTATLLRDGRVLVVGGEDSDQVMLDSVEIFDPSEGTWSSGPKLPAPRSNHVAILLASGKVLVAGGGKSTPTGQASGAAIMATSLLFDPATNTFGESGSLGEGRSHFQAALLASGRVIVVGGGSGVQETAGPDACKNAPYCGPFGKALASAEVYDAQTGKFSSAASMATARNAFTLTPLVAGGVLATGGWQLVGAGLRSTETYDETSNQWLAGPDLVGAFREHHSAARLGSGAVLIAGGKNPNVTPLDTAQTFDPETRSFAAAPKLPGPRTALGLVTLQSGRVLAVGGFDQISQIKGGPGAFASALTFDGESRTWTKLADLAQPRLLHSTTLLADGRVLVAGGTDDYGALSDCEVGEPAPQ